MSDDYDSPWKAVLERYFPAFLAFFFPVAYADIAWECGHRFLDKELQKVVRDAEIGRRWADKLVQITTHGGSEDWLLWCISKFRDNVKPALPNGCLLITTGCSTVTPVRWSA